MCSTPRLTRVKIRSNSILRSVEKMFLNGCAEVLYDATKPREIYRYWNFARIILENFDDAQCLKELFNLK